MIRHAFAVFIIVGAVYTLPFEDESELWPPVEGPFVKGDESPSGNISLTPENIPSTPKDVPLSAENVPFTPGNVPLNFDKEINANGPSQGEVTKVVASNGSKPEGTDLKTDETFWWPSFYRSFYGYPYYRRYRYYRPRSFYGYPYYRRYRYYRPRVYYRHYFW